MSFVVLEPTPSRTFAVEITTTREASAQGVACSMAAAYAYDAVGDAVLLVTTRKAVDGRNLRVAAPSNDFSTHHAWWLTHKAKWDAVLVIDAQPLWVDGCAYQTIKPDRVREIVEVAQWAAPKLRRVSLFVDEVQLQEWVDLYA